MNIADVDRSKAQRVFPTHKFPIHAGFLTPTITAQHSAAAWCLFGAPER